MVKIGVNAAQFVRGSARKFPGMRGGADLARPVVLTSAHDPFRTNRSVSIIARFAITALSEPTKNLGKLMTLFVGCDPGDLHTKGVAAALIEPDGSFRWGQSSPPT